MSGMHVAGSFETVAARPPQEPSRGSSPRGSSHLDQPGRLGEGLENPAPDAGAHLTGPRGSSPGGSSHLDHPGPVVEEVAQRPSRDPRSEGGRWTDVCALERIDRESGVAALVGGRAVAVFRTHDDAVHALDNYDPFSRASVLSRGIVGTRTVEGVAVPFVASPMFKQGFDLRTGQCLDDAAVRVAAYAVRVVPGPDGPRVEVGAAQQ